MKKLAGAVNYRYLLSLLLSILFAFLIGAGILAVSGFPADERTEAVPGDRVLLIQIKKRD